MALIGFFGCPSSGKTTIAANLFSHYKETGLSAEYIPEAARSYIAKAKTERTPWYMNEEDHIRIALEQYSQEYNFVNTVDKQTILLTDGSIFNSILYTGKEDSERLAKGHYDCLFFCDPVRPLSSDSIRLHSFEESLQIHERAIQMMEQYGSDLPLVKLVGSLPYRVQTAKTAVLEALQRLA